MDPDNVNHEYEILYITPTHTDTYWKYSALSVLGFDDFIQKHIVRCTFCVIGLDDFIQTMIISRWKIGPLFTIPKPPNLPRLYCYYCALGVAIQGSNTPQWLACI